MVLVCRWRQGERRGGREGGWEEEEEEGRRELTPRPSMFQLHQLFIVLSKDTNLHMFITGRGRECGKNEGKGCVCVTV